MSNCGTRQEASDFLDEIKRQISTTGLGFMNSRIDNKNTRSDLGLDVNIQKEIINNLTADNYCSGPEPDEKYKWKMVGVFGTTYNGVELYIKLSIGEATEKVICLSFHEAKFPMRYKF
jgi:hypothetical protein